MANSEAALDALVSRIRDDRPTWLEKGVDLNSWGPDPATNTVLIRLASYNDDAARDLSAAYGASLVTVDPESAGENSASGRTDDTPTDWWGADYIVAQNASSPSCTTWFSLHDAAGGEYVATAGHCGTHTWVNNSHVVGTTSVRIFGNYGVDAEIMPVSYSDGYVWSDPATAERRVAGQASHVVGGIVCTDGYKDLEECGVRIDQVNSDYCYDSQCTHGSTIGHQVNGFSAFTPGDSRGPVYAVRSDGGATAHGMLIAHGSDNAHGAWTPVSPILYAFSLSLTTR
ncbi:MAG: hypothetical protein ACTHK1_02775 [Actinomycetales bacterium]